jgi:hypothetical protein
MTSHSLVWVCETWEKACAIREFPQIGDQSSPRLPRVFNKLRLQIAQLTRLLEWPSHKHEAGKQS